MGGPVLLLSVTLLIMQSHDDQHLWLSQSLEAHCWFFYAPILKLGYTQLGNHLETDLSTLGWKRESHPSGNSQFEFQQLHQVSVSGTQSVQWRRWFMVSCFFLYPTCLCNPLQSPAKAPPQQPTGRLDGWDGLSAWTDSLYCRAMDNAPLTWTQNA